MSNLTESHLFRSTLIARHCNMTRKASTTNWNCSTTAVKSSGKSRSSPTGYWLFSCKICVETETKRKDRLSIFCEKSRQKERSENVNKVSRISYEFCFNNLLVSFKLPIDCSSLSKSDLTASIALGNWFSNARHSILMTMTCIGPSDRLANLGFFKMFWNSSSWSKVIIFTACLACWLSELSCKSFRTRMWSPALTTFLPDPGREESFSCLFLPEPGLLKFPPRVDPLEPWLDPDRWNGFWSFLLIWSTSQVDSVNSCLDKSSTNKLYRFSFCETRTSLTSAKPSTPFRSPSNRSRDLVKACVASKYFFWERRPTIFSGQSFSSSLKKWMKEIK